MFSSCGSVIIERYMNEDRFRQQAKKRLLTLLIVLVLIAAAFWYFSRPAGHTQIVSLESAAVNVVAQQVQKSILNPAPLIATGTNPSVSGVGQSANTLTRAGVIVDTNTARKANGGLVPLSESNVLDTIASERLADMAAKQYFAHVSPSSSSAETVARADGYDYIALGENLALGNFSGDAGVVAAWMASPEHRANILNTHYTEIGVAVKQIVFDGDETWLAVQIFGRPASDCPAPDPALEPSINAANARLDGMESELKTQQAAINAMSVANPSYNTTVDDYNTLAATYNSLLAATKANVSTYDAAVEAYNTCLGN
jgi:uncharacterized protein YkwD